MKVTFKKNQAVFQCSISDHYAVLCAIFELASTTSKTVSYNYFNLKQFHRERFCSELQTSLENKLLNVLANEEVEVDSEFNRFTFIVREIISRHAPRKKLNRSQERKSSKPWLTKGVLTSIRKKQWLYRTHFLNGNTLKKRLFKT